MSQQRLTVPALTPAQKEAQKFAEEYTRQLDEKAAREQEEERRRKEEEERRRRQQPIPLSIPPAPVPPVPLATPALDFPFAQQEREREWPQPWDVQMPPETIAEPAVVSKPTEFGATVYDPGGEAMRWSGEAPMPHLLPGLRSGYKKTFEEAPGYRNVTPAEQELKDRQQKLRDIQDGMAGVLDEEFNAFGPVGMGEGELERVLEAQFGDALAEVDPRGIGYMPFTGLKQPPAMSLVDLPGMRTAIKTASTVANILAAMAEVAAQGETARVQIDMREQLGQLDIVGVKLGDHPVEKDDPRLAEMWPFGPMEVGVDPKGETWFEWIGRWEDHPSTLYNKGYTPAKLYHEMVRVHHERPMAAQIILGLSSPENLAPGIGFLTRSMFTGVSKVGRHGVKFLPEIAQTTAGRKMLEAMMSPQGMQDIRTAIQRGDFTKAAFYEMLKAAGPVHRKYLGGERKEAVEAWLNNQAYSGAEDPFPWVAGGTDFDPVAAKLIADGGGIRIPKTGEFAGKAMVAGVKDHWEARGLGEATEITVEQAQEYIGTTLLRTKTEHDSFAAVLKGAYDRLQKIAKKQNMSDSKAGRIALLKIEQIYGEDVAAEISQNVGAALKQIGEWRKVELEISAEFQKRIDSAMRVIDEAQEAAMTRGREANSPTAVAERLTGAIESLPGMMKDERKAQSLHSIKRVIDRMDDNEIEGLRELKEAIGAYRDVKPTGMPLAEFQAKKQSLWASISEGLGKLAVNADDVAEAVPGEFLAPDMSGTLFFTERSTGKTTYQNVTDVDAAASLIDQLNIDPEAAKRYSSVWLKGSDDSLLQTDNFAEVWEGRESMMFAPGGEVQGAAEQVAGAPVAKELRTAINKRADISEDYVQMLFDDEPGVLERIARAIGLDAVTDRQVVLARNEIKKAAKESLDARGLPDEVIVWKVTTAGRHAPMSVFLSKEAAQDAAYRLGVAEGVPGVRSYKIAKTSVLADMGSVYPGNPLRRDELMVRTRNLRSPAADAVAAWEAPSSGYKNYVVEVTAEEVSPVRLRTTNFEIVNEGARTRPRWMLSRRVPGVVDDPLFSFYQGKPEGSFRNRADALAAIEEAEVAFRAESGHRWRSPQPGQILGDLSEMAPSAGWEPAPPRALQRFIKQEQSRAGWNVGVHADEFGPVYDEPFVGFPGDIGEPPRRQPRGPQGAIEPPHSAWPRADAEITPYRPEGASPHRAALFGQDQIAVPTKPSIMERIGKPRAWWLEFRRAFTNVYAHADDIERQAEIWWMLNRGEEIPVWARPGMMATLHRGSPVYAHRRVNELMDKIADKLGPGLGDDGQYFSGTVDRSWLASFLYNRHMIEIHEMHPSRSLRHARDRNKTVMMEGGEPFLPQRYATHGDAENEMAAQAYVRSLHEEVIQNLKRDHGEPVFNRILEAGEIVREEYRHLLDERVAEGIIRPEVASQLQRNYPFYHPLRYIETQGHAGLWTPNVTNRVTGHMAGLPTNDLHYLAEVGRETQAVDPLSMFNRTIMHHELAITINRTTRAYIHALKALESRDGEFVKRTGQLLVVGGSRSTSPQRMNDSALQTAAEELWIPVYNSGTYVQPAGDRPLGIAGTARVWRKPGGRVDSFTEVEQLPPGVYSFASDPQALIKQRKGVPIAPVDYVVNTPAELVKKQRARINESGQVQFSGGKPPPEGKEYVQYWENGMPQIYEVDRQVAKDLDALSRFDSHWTIRVAQALQNPYRAVITSYNPAFMAMNWVFETMQLAVVHGIMPWTSANNLRAAMFAMFRDDDTIREMTKARGLVLGGLTGRGPESMVREAIEGRIDLRTPGDWKRLMGSISNLMDSELTVNLPLVGRKGVKPSIVTSPARGARKLAEAFEVGPRRALYTTYLDRNTKEAYGQAYKKALAEEMQMRATRRGMPEGYPTPARTFEAPVLQPWETGRPMRVEGEAISLPEVQARAAAVAEREVDGMRPGLQSRAAYEARTGMVDYQRWGHFVHLADSLFLYLNAGVQGALVPLRYALRPAKAEGRPLGPLPTTAWMRNHQAQTRLMAGLAGLEGVTALVWTWNTQMSHERNNYYDIPMADRIGGMVLLLPGDGIPDGRGGWRPRYIKLWPGREFALFSGTLTYILESIEGKGHDFDLKAMLSGIAPEMNPFQSIAPVESGAETPFVSQIRPPTQIGAATVEAAQNWNAFRNQPIIPAHLKDSPTNEQWDASTSELARTVSDGIGQLGIGTISPMMLDHFAKVGAVRDMMGSLDYAMRRGNVNEVHPLIEQMAADMVEDITRLQAMDGKEDPRAMGEEQPIKEYRRQYLASLPGIKKEEFVNRREDMNASEVKRQVEALANQMMRDLRGPEFPVQTRFIKDSTSGRRVHAARVAEKKLGVDPREQRKAGRDLAEFVHSQHSQQWLIDEQLRNYRDSVYTDANGEVQVMPSEGPMITGKAWKESRFHQNILLGGMIAGLKGKYPASSFALKSGEQMDYANIMSTLAGLWPDEATRGELLLTQWRSVSRSGDKDGDDALTIGIENRRPIYLAQDKFLDSLSPEDQVILQKARESYMTPMERDWEDAKAVMKPYWEVDTKILDLIKRDDPEGKDARVWSQWLTADEVQRDVLRRAYPTTIGDILQRVRSIRNLMLGGSEQLQKELTFWGYLNAPEYLSQEERRRRGLMMPQQSGIATPTVQPMPRPEQMAPGQTVPQELPAQQLQPVAP